MVNNWIEDERSLAGWSMVSPDNAVEKDVTLVEIFKSLFIYNDGNCEPNKGSKNHKNFQRCSTFTDLSKYGESDVHIEREYSFSYMCTPCSTIPVIEEERESTAMSKNDCFEMDKSTFNHTAHIDQGQNKCVMK